MTLQLRGKDDVLWARQEIQRFASDIPFDPTDLNRIEVAASELATNLVKHGKGGTLDLLRLARDGRDGLRITATDHGPGIEDVERALTPGFSTTATLGAGLSAMRELMDKFELHTEPGRGTRVEIEKWILP